MIGFGITLGLLALLMLAVLELNQNTAIGFILLALATAGMVLLFFRVLNGGKWYWKILAWVGYLASFVGILILTWPPVKNVPAYDTAAPVRTGVVTLADGDVRGVVIQNGTVELYAGIP